MTRIDPFNAIISTASPHLRLQPVYNLNPMSKHSDDKFTLINPFEAQGKSGREEKLKYCAWEVLKDFPYGLHISQIAREIQQRKLRDLSKMRNATGQISSELHRAKEVFVQGTERKHWHLKALYPVDLGPQRIVTAEMAGDQFPRGIEIAGQRVSVWWKGERKYFEGIIDKFHPTTDTYSVIYDDGDSDDHLKFQLYQIVYRGDIIDMVTVMEHNLDEDISSDEKESKESKEVSEEWSMSSEMSCSLDSTTCGEFSDSTLKAEKKSRKRTKSGSAKKTKRGRPPLRKDISQGSGIVVTSPVQRNPNALNKATQRKRRGQLWEEHNNVKKFRLEQHRQLMPSAFHSASMGTKLEKDLKLCMKPPFIDSRSLRGIHRGNFGGSSNLLRVPRVEMINVLDLARQMQPPEDARPDLKNLTDVGELMSLSELSHELKLLEDGDSSENEVTSKHKEKVPAGDGATLLDDDKSRIKHEAAAGVSLVKAEVDEAARTDVPLSGRQAVHPVTQLRYEVKASQSVHQSRYQIGMPIGGRDLLSPSILSQYRGIGKEGHSFGQSESIANSLLQSAPFGPEPSLHAIQLSRPYSAQPRVTEIRPRGPSTSGVSRQAEIQRLGDRGSQQLPFQSHPVQANSSNDKSQDGRWKGRYSVGVRD